MGDYVNREKIVSGAELVFFIVCMLSAALAPKLALGQQYDVPVGISENLRAFLQKSEGPGDKTLRYAAARVNEGEIVVYLTGRTACGTGGCTLLVLRPDGSSFKQIGYVTTVRLPIRVLRTEPKVRPEVGAVSQWGVGDPGHEIAIRFDGHKYVKTQVATDHATGHILIPKEDEGVPLFVY